MLPPQPQTAQHSDAASERGNIQERHVAHRVQSMLLERRVSLGIHLFFLELVERRREDNVPSQQDPDRCRREDVVEGRDVVEVEEHVDVSSPRSGSAPLKLRSLWLF